MTLYAGPAWPLLHLPQMPLLGILASGAALTKALTISSLHRRKLYSDPNLDFGRKQSEIKRIDFISGSNALLLTRHMSFGAGGISERNIGYLDI